MTDQEHPDIMVHDNNETTNDQQPSASSDDLLSPQRGASRKREREPSIEPQTPKSEAGELAATDPSERKPHVAKRNRLEPLDEVESPPRSPPLDNSKAAASAAGAATPPNTTPPLPDADQTPSQEAIEPPKLQNIRKRVKDLNWKEHGSPVRGGGTAPRPKSIYDTTMEDAEQWAADEEDMEAQESHGPNEDTVIPDARPATPPSQPQEDVDIGSPQHAATVESEQKPRAKDDSNGKGTQEAPTKPNGPPEPSSVLAPAVDLTETANEERPSRQSDRRNSDSDPPSDPERTKSPSRKRKLITRETSFANDSHLKHEQYAKRPREKQDDDVSIKTIKEVKEDDPPAIPDVPGQTPVAAASPPKPTGFAAFSGVSPFAKVSGNAFGATSSSPNLASKSSDPAATSSTSKTAAPQPSKSFTSGFGAFMSASTPFASIASAVPSIFGSQASSAAPKRSASPDTASPNAGTNRSRSPSVGSLNRRKSPPPSGSAKPKPGAGFGLYNNGNFGFGSATAKTRHSPSPSLDATSKKETRDEEGSEKKKQRTEESTQTEGEDDGEGEKRGASWNELLAAKEAGGGKEEETAEQQNKKPKVEEIEVHTGEEDEETRHQARGRLFYLSEDGAWRERGTGALKINVKRETGRRARLVMRSDAVHRVILNAPLFHGMSVTLAPDPKFVKIASMENGKVAQYLFKCLGAAAAVTGQELHDQILSYIPPIDQDDEQDGKPADA
ncbi:hypothetical protein M407DRAFT_23486 [Tulasnella calospora MUT 4182]|uniref:RanBD1 domain-containing protein n=1 Tax=Tulasnella calospora MUT 4182 TaxID=1051891 RepID=A0A0C3M0Y1_9AGAM|nr:hypothetical protein M407DRAFT_23486 [Tulasnella calospora MUT 4182]